MAKIELSQAEALVLFDWLARTGEARHPVPFEDQAEQVMLWRLENILESQVSSLFSKSYHDRLLAAREAIRHPDFEWHEKSENRD